MSKSELLYMKGMNISESEGDDDDQWDDKKLNDAYDKAVRIANVEVAKRVAMSTNTASSTVEPSFFSKKEKLSAKSSKKKVPIPIPNSNTADERPKESRWKPGMPCRLIYIEDGLEYEAVVLRFIENDECIVKYLGYDNQEIVPIESLKPSLGKEARTRQIREARREQTEDSFGSLSPNIEGVDCSDRVPSPDSLDRSSQKKKKPSKKKKNQARNFNINGFDLPEVPPMPNLSMLRNLQQLGTTEMPMPPPPMAFSSVDRTDSEEQAISSMLLSWYMSGYYTGLYQGLKRAKDGRRN
uniref:Tudor domain-containing protein n=1 Tax=Heliothis virescens TaxID=7102 RepID=A0A2A4JVI2_HELVI